jgi:hypothetical protein
MAPAYHMLTLSDQGRRLTYTIVSNMGNVSKEPQNAVACALVTDQLHTGRKRRRTEDEAKMLSLRRVLLGGASAWADIPTAACALALGDQWCE